MKPLALCVILAASALAAPAADISLDLRARLELFKGSGDWQEIHARRTLPTSQTAIVICDMWDNHWCKGASGRVGVLADKMDPVLAHARKLGILIIHAPSDTMDFYAETPQRKLMLALTKVEPPAALTLTDPPLPIDDKAGGCDTHDSFFKAWTRENAKLHIAPEDVVSDKGTEIYSLLHLRGIGNILIMGVHTNMCVLNRTFAIKQMTKWGIHCVLVRDLTDAMYDPQARPYVSHADGTELVIQHIEKYWCPTALSQDIMAAKAK
jgi:nicotinamidase-related amidase